MQIGCLYSTATAGRFAGGETLSWARDAYCASASEFGGGDVIFLGGVNDDFFTGIVSIARGQWEGAKAIGMTRAMTMRRVILPQVMKRMLPAFTNRGIELAKVTSLASLLAVNEIMYEGRLLSSTYYRPLEILTVVALVYFVLIYPGSYLSARLERRLAARD